MIWKVILNKNLCLISIGKKLMEVTKLILKQRVSQKTMMERAGDIKFRLLRMKKSHSFDQTTSKFAQEVFHHVNSTNIYHPEIFGVNQKLHKRIESQIGAKTSRGTNSYFKRDQNPFEVKKYPYFSYFFGKSYLLNSFPRAHFYQRMER